MPFASAPPLQQCMDDSSEALLDDSDESFFARGPTSQCPCCKCCAVLCRCFCRNPCSWLCFPCRFRCSPTVLNPCASKDDKLASIFKNIRALAEAAPQDIPAMQDATDMPIVMPCLACYCHRILGAGVDLSPASVDVMPLGLHGFVERGLWLFPKGHGNMERSSYGCGKDVWHRASRCCCCCVGALGGCDSALRPPLSSVNPKVILYIHGGGFALTNAETYPWLLGYELVRRTGAVVLIPDYRRPPHTSFDREDSPLKGCLRLYKRLLRLYGHENIVVMGDSAGGNLALSVVLDATQDNLPAPAGLVLVSPWVDLSQAAEDSESFKCNKDTDILPVELVEKFAASYCTGDRREPLVSPVHAPPAWIERLPATMLTYGTREILFSQQQELQRKLEQAGVLQARHVYVAQGMPHVAPLFAPFIWGIGTLATPPLHPAVEAIEKIQEFLASVGYAARAD